MHDNSLNPKGWNPNANPNLGAIPPYAPQTPPSQPPPPTPEEEMEEEYEYEDAPEDAIGDEPWQGEPVEGESNAGEEEPTELVASGPSFASKIKALAAGGGAAFLKLAGGASAQLAKLPAALRKKSDDPEADPDSEDATLAEGSGDPASIEQSETDPETEPETVASGFLKTRSSRIQAAAFVSTGLLTSAFVVHNLMKPSKPSPSTNEATTKKATQVAKAEPDAAPEPKPEPELTVKSEPVAPPPTAIAAAPPEPIEAEPAPITAAPPEPLAAAAVDPLAPDLTATPAEPPPAMPALPPTETAAVPEVASPDLPLPTPIAEAPPPTVTPEPAPTEIASAPTEIAAPEPIAPTPPPETADAPPALAATPPSEPTPAPETIPSLPEPSAMAAAPALAIPTLAPPPAVAPEPATSPESMPALSPEPPPAPAVAEAPEPTPAPVVAEAPEPTPAPTPAPAPVAAAAPAEPPPTFDVSELKPLPNAGRRVLTMGTPIEGPQPIGAIPIAAAATAPLAATTVPASAESFQVEHVVQSGENFWTISKLYYGSGRFYKALWKANSRAVQAPDALVVGSTIVVPPPESLDRSLVDPPGGNIASSGRSTVRDPSARRTVQGADGSMSLPVGRSRALAESVAALEPEAPRPSHIVRDGETLRSIARDRLGNSRRESEIRQLNLDVISDDQPVVGQRLRLPNDATATQRR